MFAAGTPVRPSFALGTVAPRAMERVTDSLGYHRTFRRLAQSRGRSGRH